MKFRETTTLRELAAFLGATLKGDPELIIQGINEIHKVESGDVVFVDHPKYYKKALESEADVIIIDKEVEFPDGKGIIVSSQPFDDFNKIIKHHAPYKPLKLDQGEEFRFGENSFIHPNVVIGNNVTIGNDCVIHAGVFLGDNSLIGNNVVIGPNTVIGHDAFYYKRKDSGYDRMLSCGRVVLKDKVEIGALCTIDRGVTSDTLIGEGTKMDNQVHIGHDTVVGENCLFAANVGIAGCCVIENNVTLWGQVGVANDVVLGEGATVSAQSGVSKSLEGGAVYFGSPAAEARIVLKQLAALKKLPDIIDSL